jgi:hypothetical protein
MKMIITENRLEKAIIKWLDDEYYPDYGWYENDRAGTYQDDVDKFGDVIFFIDDDESYTYYGCNANNRYGNLFGDDGYLSKYECPLLSIGPKVSQSLTSVFGDIWKPIFQKWFEEHTGLQVKQFTDDNI